MAPTAGFVGGNDVQYVIVVFNTEPKVAGYAGRYGGSQFLPNCPYVD